MIVNYQPVIEIASQRVVRAEVFCRFPDGDEEMRDIRTFIPHAENVGLIRELTRSVMFLALTERKAWNVALPLSFNVSPLDLEDPVFFDRTMAALARFEVNPRAITLELNDGIQNSDSGEALATIRRLRAAGVRLCVDGFGTDMSIYSHLELERILASEVKIDVCGFIGAAKRTLLTSVVEIAKNLHIDVVVKGVETLECLELAGNLGCGFGQGYAIARPMDGEALVAWLADREIVEIGAPAPVPERAEPIPKRSFFEGFFGKRVVK